MVDNNGHSYNDYPATMPETQLNDSSHNNKTKARKMAIYIQL